MISRTTSVSGNKFKVTFTFNPTNVTHSRTNSRGTYTATHRANGTTARQGIWEGIERVEVWTKIGNNAWRSHGNTSSVTVETTKNGETIQGCVRYRLRTMGHHWNDLTGKYPFFYFGNIGGVAANYSKGKFTDSAPVSPGNEHKYCIVPPDWSYKWCEWSDWAYQHAKSTGKNGNWAVEDGRFEQRNNKYESANADNGWISDSNRGQMWRKPMMFFFEKDYYSSVVSAGIPTEPNLPTLQVHWAKGDGGNISVQYTDNAGHSGKVYINAYCNGRTANILNWNNSWNFYNGETRNIWVDFNNAFGESCRGHDVYYEAWSQNNQGYYAPGSTGWKGVQRYNGRPSVPTGLRVSGVNGIIYHKIQIDWNSAWDPDGDYVVYDIWLRCVSKEGRAIKDDYIARGYNGLSMTYDISNFPEESTIQVWVCSSDSSIVSDWSSPVSCQKGAVPKGNITLISPSVSWTTLYNRSPRFSFQGYDGKSEFVVVVNNREFTSYHHGHLFHIHGDKVMFQPDVGLANDTSCYAYMRNQYGNGNISPTWHFTITDPYENVTEGNIVTAQDVRHIQQMISDFGRAYNQSYNFTEIKSGGFITAAIYNECQAFLNSVAWAINNSVPNTPFTRYPQSPGVSPGQFNDDALWDQLVIDLKNI